MPAKRTSKKAAAGPTEPPGTTEAPPAKQSPAAETPADQSAADRTATDGAAEDIPVVEEPLNRAARRAKGRGAAPPPPKMPVIRGGRRSAAPAPRQWANRRSG